MTECPVCKLSLDSHSTGDLMECSKAQLDDQENFEESSDKCPNCKHEINSHTNQQLAECILAYFKSV